MVQPALITNRFELDRAFDASDEGALVIFKHSLACAVSVSALQEYRDFLAGRETGDGVLYTLVEVQNARDISDEISERTGVRHASPQVLLMKGREVVWSATHWDISRDALEEALSA